MTPQHNTPIRIVHAIYSLSGGGAEVLAWRVAKALLRSGRYHCSLFVVQKEGPSGTLLNEDDISYKVFSRNRRIDLLLLGRLAAQLKANEIQLVHTHGLGELLYAGLAARIVGARVVHTVHGIYYLKDPRSQMLLRLLSKVADRVTAVGKPGATFLRDKVGIAPQKINTIISGIDSACFAAATPITRSVWGWREKDIVVGCVARLEPEKGVGVLLEAFHFVLMHHPNAKLLIAGDGSEREKLRRTAECLGLNGSVQFLGTRSDIPEVLATCDVIALPSLHEGLPMALLEAMAARKPVIATNVGAIPEVIKNGRSGILVPPGRADLLAKALSVLIGDQDKRHGMGAEAFKTVQESYSFNEMLQKYEALYEAVLSGQMN
jgi:glycosyltransferase involved in cell wall biosynthesis